jgi:cbb3-type cytochrome oxidase maturation protein
MSALMWLAPMSILLGALGLAAFAWTFSARQYEDPHGDAARILLDDGDAPPPAPAAASPLSSVDESDAG